MAREPLVHQRMEGARLTTGEIAFGVALAGASGAAIVAHTFWAIPMRFSVPLVVLPSTLVLVGALLVGLRNYSQLHLVSRRLMLGALWGLLATLGYDLVRPALLRALGLSFDPFRAMPVFGHLITGLPTTDSLAITVGWIYHFWNGVSFGMMFGLIRPRGGWISGWAWGLGLEAIMLSVYPNFLEVRLSNPGFLASSIVGHSLWGIILGAGLRRMGERNG